MKKIIVNAEHLQTRIALVENDKIDEYYIERTDDKRIVGSIFKGKIRNLENSLQAAFVDIGLDKNSFLHYWDMIPAT
ncbi:MAG: ribonuclease E/G, partial [Lentisphaeria bacterium]|nr:ribonuclease E/G [Lentisphaeria bacterium]